MKKLLHLAVVVLLFLHHQGTDAMSKNRREGKCECLFRASEAKWAISKQTLN